MGNLLTVINWIEKSERMDVLLLQADSLTIHPIDQGFEAEVIKLSFDQEGYVLKIWNKGSQSDVCFQFHLLKGLVDLGISVPKPIGWGINPNGDKVLLTTFDGIPAFTMNNEKMSELANILSSIHQVQVEEIQHVQLPKYGFIDYFFWGAKEHHPDLYAALVPLVEMSPIKQDRMIHGDYHIGNIVDNNEQYTVIDWTNGQLGDSRYDFAWALIILKIYVPERFADVFRSTYLLNNEIGQEELHRFEALACLRWIFLNRNGYTPTGPQIIEKATRIVRANPFLRDLEFIGISSNKKAWSGDGMNNGAVWTKFPILKSKDYVLKRIEDNHLDEVYEIYSNDHVFQYCGIIPKHNKGTVKNMIGHFDRDYNKGSRVKWGIFNIYESDRLLGIIEAFDFNQKVNMVTIGYFLAESRWGRGTATEAVRILVDYLFMEVNVNRIQAEVMPSNESSKKVLLKNGFIKEGTLRQAALWSGKGIVDLELYSILKEDFVK